MEFLSKVLEVGDYKPQTEDGLYDLQRLQRATWGWTPLHYAAAEDNRDMAELLIDKDADVNAKESDGKTALSLAKEKGHTEIVELLLKHGAKE